MNQKNEVMATLLSDNPLLVGPDTMGKPVLGLDGFREVVNGQPRNFMYLDESGKKSGLIIDGQRAFDLGNPIDEHNWNTLKVDLALHPDLANDIRLIDPNQEAEDEMKAAKKLKNLLDILMDHETDSEWLAKVYRRVLGMASGLTSKVLFRALWDKAKTEMDSFAANGKWLFDGEYFETESLLDLACERGIILRDTGDFYKKQDGSPLADGRAKAVFVLSSDPAYRNYVTQAVSTPMLDVAPSPIWNVEDSDLLDLVNNVGAPVALPAYNADGSVDESAADETRQLELEALVETAVAGSLFEKNPQTGLLTSVDLNITAGSADELVGMLKAQPQLEAMLREFTTI